MKRGHDHISETLKIPVLSTLSRPHARMTEYRHKQQPATSLGAGLPKHSKPDHNRTISPAVIRA